MLNNMHTHTYIYINTISTYMNIGVIIYICMYIAGYIYTNLHASVCMHTCMYVCMHACMYVCMHACMCVFMHVLMYVYVRIYTYMHMYLCRGSTAQASRPSAWLPCCHHRPRSGARLCARRAPRARLPASGGPALLVSEPGLKGAVPVSGFSERINKRMFVFFPDLGGL